MTASPPSFGLLALVRDLAGGLLAVVRDADRLAADCTNGPAVERYRASADAVRGPLEMLISWTGAPVPAPAPEPPPERQPEPPPAPEPAPAPPKPGEDPSWAAACVDFCAAIDALGLEYAQVAGWCEHLRQPPPKLLPPERRERLLGHLKSGGAGTVRSFWAERALGTPSTCSTCNAKILLSKSVAGTQAVEVKEIAILPGPGEKTKLAIVTLDGRIRTGARCERSAAGAVLGHQIHKPDCTKAVRRAEAKKEEE